MSETTLGPAPARDPPRVQVRMGAALRRPLLSRRALEQIVSLLAPLFLLLVWEGLARGGLLDRRFFPAPSSIICSAKLAVPSFLPTSAA